MSSLSKWRWTCLALKLQQWTEVSPIFGAHPNIILLAIYNYYTYHMYVHTSKHTHSIKQIIIYIISQQMRFFFSHWWNGDRILQRPARHPWGNQWWWTLTPALRRMGSAMHQWGIYTNTGKKNMNTIGNGKTWGLYRTLTNQHWDVASKFEIIIKNWDVKKLNQPGYAPDWMVKYSKHDQPGVHGQENSEP